MAHHILIFPLPIQGAVNPMLKLAELIWLASNGQIQVTFLTTEHVHRRLELHAGGAERFSRHAGFSFRTFADGLPIDHPRGGDKFMEMLNATEKVSQPLIRDILMEAKDKDGVDKPPPVACVIADGLFTFVLDVGRAVGTPVMYFDTISPCCLWVYLCLPGLVQDGVVPFQEKDDLEEPLSFLGMENLLRRCDLPDFCRANNPFTNFMIKRVTKQANQYSKAQGIIFNSFDALETPLLSCFSSHLPSPVYVIGPLHLHLKERTKQTQTIMMSTPLSPSLACPSNSLWHEDKSCLEWLDQQCPQSVIFCSFGSQVAITKDQLLEFWYGLVNSKTRFLWVKRPGSVIGLDNDKWYPQVPLDLLKGVKEYGMVTSWVPQEEVLSHVSIGGFLTHSGWNSTIESIAAGVSMICWPHYVDQLVNSRYVSDVWRVGVDMKDTCDRVVIENMVRDLMKCRRDEFGQEAKQLSELAMQSVDKDGSSYCSLNRLIDDIKSFKS